MTGALRAEREERIRSPERAELAARVHDSVLQTLALIQRSADSPRDVVRLARGQERELRSLLYETASASASATAIWTSRCAPSPPPRARHSVSLRSTPGAGIEVALHLPTEVLS